MTTFFTSDWHLHHSKILQYCPYSRKGNTPEQMTEMILDNIADQTNPGDIIYNIGDVSFGTMEQTIICLNLIKNKLRVQHHLILGNHDHRITKSTELSGYFTSVQDYKTVSIRKQFIVMSHFPMTVWDKAHYGSWMLSGHKHSTYQEPNSGKCLDVGIDTRQAGDMRMYSFDEIEQIMRVQKKAEHH